MRKIVKKTTMKQSSCFLPITIYAQIINNRLPKAGTIVFCVPPHFTLPARFAANTRKRLTSGGKRRYNNLALKAKFESGANGGANGDAMKSADGDARRVISGEG